MMDEESAKMLAEITAKEPAALTEVDIAFLKARRSYLTEHQRNVFAEFLVEAKQAAPEVTSEATEQESSADEAPRRTRRAN